MNNIKIFRHLTLGVFLLCSLGLFAQSPLYYAYGNVQSRTVLGANEYNITINNFSGGYREYPLANYERADIPLVPTDYVVWINCVRFRVLSRVSTVPFVLRVKDDLGTGGLTGTDLISYRLGIIQEARYDGYNLGAETSVVDGNAGAMAGINPYEGACMANYYKRQMKLALTAPDTLTNGRIWVGNTQNLAQERLMSGDGSITNTGILSITQAVGSFSLPAESYLSTNVTVNNFNIGNSAVAEFEPIAAHSVTGFNGGIDGRLLFVENLGGFTIMLENQHAGSVAGNRMALPGAVMLTPGSAATLIYNTFDNRRLPSSIWANQCGD